MAWTALRCIPHCKHQRTQSLGFSAVTFFNKFLIVFVVTFNCFTGRFSFSTIAEVCTDATYSMDKLLSSVSEHSVSELSCSCGTLTSSVSVSLIRFKSWSCSVSNMTSVPRAPCIFPYGELSLFLCNTVCHRGIHYSDVDHCNYVLAYVLWNVPFLQLAVVQPICSVCSFRMYFVCGPLDYIESRLHLAFGIHL